MLYFLIVFNCIYCIYLNKDICVVKCKHVFVTFKFKLFIDGIIYITQFQGETTMLLVRNSENHLMNILGYSICEKICSVFTDLLRGSCFLATSKYAHLIKDDTLKIIVLFYLSVRNSCLKSDLIQGLNVCKQSREFSRHVS